MNKYKFLGMLFHFIYRALSGTTKKEYYYEIENFDMNSQNIVVFWHRKIFTICLLDLFIFNLLLSQFFYSMLAITFNFAINLFY